MLAGYGALSTAANPRRRCNPRLSTHTNLQLPT